MIKGVPGEWYQDEYIGGYFDAKGELVVCEEYGLTDADTDSHAVDVMNGLGYYDDDGWYHRYEFVDEY